MKTVTWYKAFLFLIAIIFIPSLFMMLFDASSMTMGLLLVLSPAFIIYLISAFATNFKIKTCNKEVFLYILFYFIFPLHFAAVIFLFENPAIDHQRFFFSILAAGIFIIAAKYISTILFKLNNREFHKLIQLICLLFIINAIVSLTGYNFFGYERAKPTFLFSEPSHFALAVAPFFIYCLKLRVKYWKQGLLFFILWALYIQNFTMIVVLTLAILCAFSSIIYAVIFFVLAFLSIYLFSLDISYFTERINFSTETDNLSALVFIQGWENAILTLGETSFLGCGFQQFGITSSAGEATDKIGYIYEGGALNIFDGGTSASKLIGELGLFGVALLGIILIKAYKSFFWLKKTNAFSVSKIAVFKNCVAISILVEFFFRGVGYFSVGIFIYIVTILLPSMQNRSESSL